MRQIIDLLKNIALENFNEKTPKWIKDTHQWKKKFKSNVDDIVSFVEVLIVFCFIVNLLHKALHINGNLILNPTALRFE